jgi:hypothetical protein
MVLERAKAIPRANIFNWFVHSLKEAFIVYCLYDVSDV